MRAGTAAERKTNTKMMPHQTCMNKLARLSRRAGRVGPRDEASRKVDRQARTEMLDGYNVTCRESTVRSVIRELFCRVRHLK